MTLASATNRVTYTGNGSTATYSYTFRIFAQTDLVVTIRDNDDVETEQVLTTDYTVTGVGSIAGGTIVLVDGNLTSGYVLTIRRVRPLTQLTDIRNQGSFFPETHEDSFDHGIMVAQQQQDDIDRSVKLPETVDPDDFDIDLPADLVGAVSCALITNAAGDGFDVGPTTDEISSAQSYAVAAAGSASSAIKVSEFLNVTAVAYGAVGNGVADDTTAFQDALDDAGALGGATVFVPPGLYKITANLNWPDASGVSLIGSGKGQSTLKFTHGAAPSTSAIGIYILSAGTTNNTLIKGLTLQGLSNTDSAIYELIRVDNGVNDFTLEECELKWARHAGCNTSQNPRQERANILNNYFHHINSSAMTGGSGAALEHILHNSKIIGNTFEDIGNAGGFHGFYMSGTDTHDVVIANNTWIGNGSSSLSDLQIFDNVNSNISITGNVFHDSLAHILDVVGCVYSGNSHYNSALKVGSSNMLVIGNYFYCSNSNQLMLPCDSSVSNVIIRGNVFQNTSAANSTIGISIDSGASSCDSWTISENYFLSLTESMILYGTNHAVMNNRIITTSTAEQIWFKSGSGHVAINNLIKVGSTGRAVTNESGSVAIVRGNHILGGGAENGSSGGVVTVGQPYATTGLKNVTTSYTATANDSIIVGSGAAGNITITLPPASGGTFVGRYKEYTIKNIHASNTVIVDADASETIDGATTKTCSDQYSFITIIADPDNGKWVITAKGGTIT